MEKIKFSIVMPFYNSKNYLKRSINSILSQTYENFELIIVNDGSTDGGELLCKELTEGDERVKLVNKENGGAASARNTAFKYVTGDYLMFVDADDELYSYSLNKLFEVISQVCPDLILFAWDKVFDNGEILKEQIEDFPKSASGVNISKKILQNKCGSGYLCNKVWKTKIIQSGDKLESFKEDLIVIEDYEWIMRNIVNVNTASCINDSLYVYHFMQSTPSHHAKMEDNWKSVINGLCYINDFYGNITLNSVFMEYKPTYKIAKKNMCSTLINSLYTSIREHNIDMSKWLFSIVKKRINKNIFFSVLSLKEKCKILYILSLSIIRK